MDGKESFSVKRLVIHDFIDDGTGACAFPFGQTYCGYRCDDEIHGYKALPADWFEDSSLETWFPFTAEELAELKRQLAATQEPYLRVSDLAVNLTATLRSIANANYREWEELATPGEFVKWAQSVARAATQPTPTAAHQHESFSCPSNNCGECQRESAIEGKS